MTLPLAWGLIGTVTAIGVAPPYPSMIVTVKVSALSAAEALSAAALFRAVAVGV